MLLSSFSFSLMGVFVKYLKDVPIIEKVLFRNLVSLIIAYAMVLNTKSSMFGKPSNRWYLFSRSLLGFFGVALIFYSISNMKLADSSIFQYMSPFFVTLFAIMFLKEKVGLLHILSLCGAFIGAMLVIKPGFSYTILPAVAGVAAAAFAGSAYTIVSFLKDKESPATIVFNFSLVTVVISLPMVLFRPYIPSLNELFFLILTGIAAAAGQFGITNAYRHTAASEVSMYNYSGILFSAVLGFLIWNEIPDIFTIIGALMIIGSGYLVYRAGKKIDPLKRDFS